MQADVIVNCTGIGANELCQDSGVLGMQGDIVLVFAPHVRHAYSDETHDGIGYIIPRGDGTVILGGTTLSG